MRDSVDEHIAAWSEELADLDPVQEAVIGRIHLLARHSTQGRQLALRSDDLTGWQFKTLLMLRKLGRPYTTSPSQLASLLGVTRGALSNRLSSLEELGYVVRTTEAGDRRRVRVTLTPAGRRTLEAAMDAEGAVEERILGVLSDRERLTLADLLRKVVVGIEGGAS